MKQDYLPPLNLRWQLLFSNKLKMRLPLLGIISFLLFGISFSISAQTTEFNYTGAIQTYTVPAGVTSLNVKLYGAQAGGSEICGGQINDDGGKGGYAEGILSVTPGQVLSIYVGGKPNTVLGAVSQGGYNGGGSAGRYGGPGGGGSDLRINGTALANRVIVAGGGGGGNAGCPDHGTGGAGGGLVGAAGQGSNLPGAGGTQTAGGVAGSNGQAGSLGQGGMTDGYHTAGGGGGFYGGGSAYASGAGGGSSYIGGVTDGTTQQGLRSGNGYVQVTVLQSTYYADADADGYGNVAISQTGLTQPEGYVLRAGDCNDNDATINPGATDLCDGIDRNCDGVVKNKPTAIVSGSQTICAGQYANISVNLTGVAPWSITYTDGSEPITINNIQGLSAFTIPVNPSVTTTYRLLALSDANCEAASLPNPVVITVNQAPVLTVPANQIVNTEAGRAGASVPFAATATGVPAPTISYAINGAAVTSPYFFPVGVTTVTVTATNSCTEDSETFTVTVEDKEVPAAVAKNITVQLNAAGNLTITAADIDNGSSDASGLRSLVLSKTNFDCSTIGANEVILTATDNHGNVATATATVTVEDKIAPAAIAKNITVQLNADGNANITADQVNNGSTDNCGIASLALDKTTFDCSNKGTNEVTLTVTDVNGLKSTATATVTVEDKTGPVAVAQNITVQLDAAGQATITTDQVNNGSIDNCGIATLVLSKSAFDCSNVGANSVTLTVTDVNGNVSTATSIVTVEDKIAPMALGKNLAVALNAEGMATITANQVNNGSTDNCSIATMILSKSTFDCSNAGANTVTLTITDVNGNESEVEVVVTVEEKTDPVALAKNITVQLNEAGTVTVAAAAIDNGSSDNCGIATMVLSKTDFDCSNVGDNSVTLTITDMSGNSHSATATITVEDKVAPVAIAKNITVQLNATGTASIAAADVNNSSTDACGIAAVTVDKTTFDCANVGANAVTLTITDTNGNVATATATVTVEDKMAPTLEAPVAITIDVDAGKTTASNVTLGTPVTTDNCGVTSVTNDAPAEFSSGITTVTWTAQDAAGNTVTATQMVTVRTYIAAFTRPATIQVPIRTTFSNIGLPTTVEVTYNNNTKENIPVTWNAGTYNGAVAGMYELTSTLTLAPGTTNQNNVEVKMSVEVQPNKVPTALALSKNTFSPNIASTEVIGTFATTDADDTEHVYTLVKEQGDANNNWFEIRGNALYLKSNEGLSGKTQFSIRVKTTDAYNNTFEQTFTLTKGEYAKAVADLKIVNTFTPNNDGINDDWTIPELKFYNQVEIEVFDRSGVRLFHTTDPEKGWDGKDQHGLVRKGSYLYVVQVKDINLVKKGVVSILKK